LSVTIKDPLLHWQGWHQGLQVSYSTLHCLHSVLDHAATSFHLIEAIPKERANQHLGQQQLSTVKLFTETTLSHMQHLCGQLIRKAHNKGTS
jgi:hypothetical protein